MVTTAHQAAMMIREIVMAEPMVSPKDSHPRISTRQTTNGMQLPM